MENINRYRYRCRHLKLIPFHLLSQLDLTRFWDRAIRRAQLPVAFSQGFNPRPQLSYGPATPTGVVSHVEYLDMILTEPFDSDQLKDRLNRQVPEGMNVTEVDPISLDSPGVIKSLMGVQYSYVFDRGSGTEDNTIPIDIEDIELIERKIRSNREFMISFLFKGKSILYNPYKLIDLLPIELKLNGGNPIVIIKQDCIFSFFGWRVKH